MLGRGRAKLWGGRAGASGLWVGFGRRLPVFNVLSTAPHPASQRMVALLQSLHAGLLACWVALCTQTLLGGLVISHRVAMITDDTDETSPSAATASSTVFGSGGEYPETTLLLQTMPSPPPSPRLPPYRPPPMPQPDELISPLSMPTCQRGTSIPPESIHTTKLGGGTIITIFVRTTYRGDVDAGHRFDYTVEFQNTGTRAVQLLTRHIVFVDDRGRTEAIKGPGAKGAMPTFRAGDAWSYSSSTVLRTRRGSMHGWFTFEALGSADGGKDSDPHVFVASVARLALSASGRAEDVPCASPVAEGSVFPTSVYRSEGRVFVGAVVALLSQDADVGRYAYLVDVQVNNALAQSLFLVGYKWEVIDAHGQRFRSEGHGLGQQDGKTIDAIKMPPGSAMRIRSEMPQIHTATATIHGVLLARIVTAEEDDEQPVTAPTDDVAGPIIELVVAPLGASVDGEPVQEHKALGFLPE